MDVPHDTKEFEVTPVRFNVKGSVLSWRFELVCPMKVIEDQGDHTDMTSEEEEVCHELLQDLEPSFNEED